MGIESGDGSTFAQFLTPWRMLLEFVSFPNGRGPWWVPERLLWSPATQPLERREDQMPADLTLPGLGPVHHRAYLVESIEDTVARLVEQFGAGPFFALENVPLENVTSRGEVAEFSHNSAFGHLSGDAIELMEINQLSPVVG
jgi:hypothetical protein